MDEWLIRLREQRKGERDKKVLEDKQREEQRSAPNAILFKKRPVQLLEKNNES